MRRLRKLLILDDDPHCSGMLALKLRQRFPELMISSSDRNKLMNGYDVYVLDNDFGGDKCGASLAEEVRRNSPGSLVMILSGTLEMDLLKRLVNCHAAGVFDKSKPDDLERLMQLTEDYLMCSAAPDVTQQSSKTIGETLSGISDLLSEWNRRLAFEEKR